MKYLRILLTLLACIVSFSIYSQSYQELKKSADKGDPEALGKLGACYYWGQNGVEKDYTKAFKLLNEATNRGYMAAKYVLAGCYENGHGTSQNKDKAISLYKESYDFGIGLAAKSLGKLYVNENDYDNARIWFEKCESLNDGYVNWMLGSIYYFGLETDIDYDKSFNYYKESHDTGYINAYYSLGLCYYLGHGIDKDEKEAVNLWKECGNNSAALNKLGICYSEGKGVKKDIKTAIDYWERAYALGDLTACYNLGIIYLNGTDVKENIELAKRYFEDGALKGHKESARKLGLQYLIGEKLPYSISLGNKYLTISANAGDGDSQYLVGSFLIQGDSIPQDSIQGLKYMKLAADQFHKEALEYYADWNYSVADINTAIEYWEKGVSVKNVHCMNNLGVCYINGLGKSIDYSKGFRLFEDSYQIKENPLSLVNMAECYYSGHGVSINYETTCSLLEKAMRFEDVSSSAYFLLSKCYRFGRGVHQNIQEADRLLNIASQMGNADAIAISNLIVSQTNK